jgi:hypothetical protein
METARVRCRECEYAWFGRSAAHGLAILGHCPRCQGELRFVRKPAPDRLPLAEPTMRDVLPSRVLGLPVTWG